MLLYMIKDFFNIYLYKIKKWNIESWEVGSETNLSHLPVSTLTTPSHFTGSEGLHYVNLNQESRSKNRQIHSKHLL